MSEDNSKSFWRVLRPSVWPQAPEWMSFSALMELEACPRRWALSAAEYLDVWKYRGYPSMPNPASLEGTVVHLSLQKITSALIEHGCHSLFDERAVWTLRNLGGYTAIITGSMEQALRPYKENPRAIPIIDEIRRRLIFRVPDLRSRVQRLLSRINPQPRAMKIGETATLRSGKSRHKLQYGSHSEIQLRASEIRWRGTADMITVSTNGCEIRDFKTGTPKDEHKLQLLIYALLWARDGDLNPSGLLANKLVLSYDDGDVEVPVPEASVLWSLEEELKKRTAAAIASIHLNPPETKPSQANCKYCAVRHLCEEFWCILVDLNCEDRYTDIQIKVSSKHGPNSWDGVVEFGSNMKIGAPVLLRTANLQFNLQTSLRLRLLNVYMSIFEEDGIDDKVMPCVVSMGANSEAFLLGYN